MKEYSNSNRVLNYNTPIELTHGFKKFIGVVIDFLQIVHPQVVPHVLLRDVEAHEHASVDVMSNSSLGFIVLGLILGILGYGQKFLYGLTVGITGVEVLDVLVFGVELRGA